MDRAKIEENRLRKAIESKLRYFPDFPRQGINFVDIMPLFNNPSLLNELCAAIGEHAKNLPVKIDAVAGFEARGFLFGPQVSIILNLPFIPIRKKGKLPGEVIQEFYEKEYGQDVIEIQKDAIKEGWNVFLIDDLLATGGTLLAAVRLFEKSKARIVEAFTLIELSFLNARNIIPNHIPIYSLILLSK